MLQSINKYKLYLYFFFFIFLSSIFNFKFIENYNNKFSLKNININGLSYNEKIMLENELNKFKNTNIFQLNETKISNALDKFNFLENIFVYKIIPSTININLSKTQVIGQTLRNGEIFYIGKNGKFISTYEIYKSIDIPSVFGNFQIGEYIELQNILNDYKIDVKTIKEYYYYKNKRWDLLFHNGILLKLPSENIIKSLKIYRKFFDNKDLLNISIVDLRITDQIILTKNNE